MTFDREVSAHHFLNLWAAWLGCSLAGLLAAWLAAAGSPPKALPHRICSKSITNINISKEFDREVSAHHFLNL
jgi:hypothetical protein